MANFTRFAKVVDKTPDKHVVSVTVSPVVKNCSGRIWFTDLCLQEGNTLTGYHPNPEIFLKKFRVNGEIKPPVWFNGVVRSKETVVLFNCGQTSAPLDIHIHPTADMAAGSITLCQGVGGQRAAFPNAIEKDADLALLAESRLCTKDGEPEQKEGFYQYSAAWDSKHTVTLEDKKSAVVLFSMQEMEDYRMPILTAETEILPEPTEPEIKDDCISVIQLNTSLQYTTTVHYFTTVADAVAMVSENPKFMYSIIIGENAGITEIASLAFAEIENLCELQIPDSVSAVGEYLCYWSKNLRKLRLPNNPQFTSIPRYMCNGCENLESIEIPNCVYTIETRAFESTGISNIVFSESLRVIKDYAFLNCLKLEKIIFPTSMKSVGASAFFNCKNVQQLTLNTGLQVINPYAFKGIFGITEVVIPATVQAIMQEAFAICPYLQDVTLQDGLSYIGASAFETTKLKKNNHP